MSQPRPTTDSAELAETTRRKIKRRLGPFLLLLYTVAFLDRVNLSYASLEMTKELHFSNSVYGLGAGIFFLGYWFLEVRAQFWLNAGAPERGFRELWSAGAWLQRSPA